MGRPRRRIPPALRAPAEREEKMEEPEAGEPRVTEEADDFHERRLEEAVLAALGREDEEEEEVEEEEEEVLGLHLSENSESEEDGDDRPGEEEEEYDEPLDMDSDLEEQRGEGQWGSGLPSELAWGQRKKLYYGTDYEGAARRPKAPKKTKEEVEAEELEEEAEAQAIQRRMAENLAEEDYGLDLLQAYTRTAEPPSRKESGQKIAKDLASLSRKEQLKLLRKESPELLELIQDFEAKVVELRDELEPLMQMMGDGVIPAGKGSQYLQTKYHLYLNYCCNISFYLVLKAKRIPIHGHPVIERLVTYRNLINDLAVVDQKLLPEVRLLLKEFRSNETDGVESRKKLLPLVRKTVHKRKTKSPNFTNNEAEDELADDSDFDEQAALDFYKEMEEKIMLKKKRKREEKEGTSHPVVEEVESDQKRGATYQMLKNKGLTPRRKKIDRNPRVKHREKFRKAKIRRRGQVREFRRETQKYAGELSGIRAGVKKSIKLK
ncbi:something about silencing protein 10 isoform X1 [Notechis scutatus]|uniref:Something about silencing protein 10 isoform X1 n=1 Tax=Notechis scutatus TaxID=8663 RepID=A0A6J1UUP3_9SAUR|nr:something about silencing protein 10 isoform X1 [Notechis scutatus]